MKFLPYLFGYSTAYDNFFQVRVNVSENERHTILGKLGEFEHLKELDYFKLYNQLDLILHESEFKQFDEILSGENVDYKVLSKNISEKMENKTVCTADLDDFDYWPLEETFKFYESLNQKYPDYASFGPFGLTRHLKPLWGGFIRDSKKADPEKR